MYKVPDEPALCHGIMKKHSLSKRDDFLQNDQL